MSGDVSGATGAVEELPTYESLALLRESPVGRLAVVVEGRPDIFPVNHVVDHGTVVFRTARGSKFWGRQVCRWPSRSTVTTRQRTRMERGRTREGEILIRSDDVLEALQLPIFPWQSGAKPEFLRIVPDEITGRRFEVPGGARYPSGSQR